MNRILRMMASTSTFRKEPIIFIIGCTGTGKSDLGIAICKKYGGEVISVDSMQFYKGMDIATNKVTEEEADGIPHHLMSFLDPSSHQKYHVHQFKKQTLEIIKEMRSRSKIPVIVGGTTYYAESILFEDNFIETPAREEQQQKQKKEEDDVDLSNQQLWELLSQKDPESASLVHPNNRERVRRALEIHELTGRKKSELIKEQKEAEQDLPANLRFDDSLVLYLDASADVLNDRLDGRVEKMVRLGLKKELAEFYGKHEKVCQSNPYGVMQCIGLKEFIPWLQLNPEDRETTKGADIFRQCSEAVKLHTRQYAKRQRRWFQSRLVRRRGTSQKSMSMKLVDTSDKSTIISGGIAIVDDWINGKDFSEKTEEDCAEAEAGQDANRLFKCEMCEITVSGKRNWEKHLSGKKHKNGRKKSKEA